MTLRYVLSILFVIAFALAPAVYGAGQDSASQSISPIRGLVVGNGESVAYGTLEPMYVAKSFIGASFYLQSDDTYGLMPLALAREAARRGVRVHFMIDAYTLMVKPEIIMHLLQEGVDFKVYNDVPLYQLGRVNHRNHTKTLVTDHDFGFLVSKGDANFEDKYVQWGDGHHMVSFNMLATGKPAEEAYKFIIEIFNSELATRPIVRVGNQNEYDQQQKIVQRNSRVIDFFLNMMPGAELDAPIALASPRDKIVTQQKVNEARQILDNSFQEFLKIRKERNWPNLAQLMERMSVIQKAEFVYDPIGIKGLSVRQNPNFVDFIKSLPQKLRNYNPFVFINSRNKEKIGVHRAAFDVMKNARESLSIYSPYMVLSVEDKDTIRAALSRNVKVKLYTNSWRSSDNPLVQSAYEMRVAELAALGPIEIYEWINKSTWHAKIMIADHRIFAVKSLNMDFLSKFGNLEDGIFGDDPEFAREIERTLDGVSPMFMKVAEKGELLRVKKRMQYLCRSIVQPTFKRKVLETIEPRL